MMSIRSKYRFFFNDTATTEIYTLSLHDALPISLKTLELLDRPRDTADKIAHIQLHDLAAGSLAIVLDGCAGDQYAAGDRKSTRLNSSHANISYAVFCLKKRK